jgi:selenoprotein W-related protein
VVDVLREEFGVEARLIPGRGGIFEVRVDDHVVAKKTFDGFPMEDEIVQAVAGVLARG